MGRNVFQSEKPLAMMKAISAVVHQGMNAKDAFQLYKLLHKLLDTIKPEAQEAACKED